MSIEAKLEKLMVCEKCKVLGGTRDLFFLKKTRCPLCQKATSSFKIPNPTSKNGGKNVLRFPREAAIATAEQQAIGKKIADRCKDFDCPGKIVDVLNGPVVTEYVFEPDRFTRVKKLKTLNEDLALSLNVDTVTIRRISSKAAIGISIPNPNRKPITFKDCLKNVIEHRYDMALPINMGITSTGEPYIVDLCDYPHLLVAGTTGTGKSVFLNNVLNSLLYIRTSKELQLVMVDPKSVELFPYKGLPHMMMDPVKDVWQALSVMDTLDAEMRRRTNNLHVLKADNIKTLNARIKAEVTELRKAGKVELAAAREADLWPYIIFVIDEMADLVLAEKKEFTTKLACLAQMARAAGICIIAATQRPSVDILPGKIKVNFPSRAAFKVPSATDSKTILGYKGAEGLLGKGDMFLMDTNKSGLQRLHVPLCTREDRDEMLRLSLEHGHINCCPADFLPKEEAKLEVKAEPIVAKKNGNGKKGK